ncbi:MAG: hypothetical protein ACOY42_09610 [Pseudomonadota bacterium]
MRDFTLSKYFSALALIALLAGCATAPAPAPEPKTPEEALRERVEAYYQALIAKDYKGAYEFFTPGYRSTWSATDHYQIHPIIGTWLSAKVLSVDCVSEEVCDVMVNTRFRFNQNVQPLGGQEIPMDTRHRWLKADGEWYYLPRS